MTLPYTPPGVTVREEVSPSIVPLLAVPDTLMLIGKAGGYPTASEVLTLSGTTPVALTQAPATSTVTLVSVTDFTDPTQTALSGYISTADYTFDGSTNAITRVNYSTLPRTLSGSTTAGATSFTLNSGAVPATGEVVRLTDTVGNVTETAVVSGAPSGQTVTVTAGLVNAYPSGAHVTWGIADGHSVLVTYSYIAADYWQPIRLNSMVDIQDRFGPALSKSGNAIVSRLSYAAMCAFNNGASSVVLQPFYHLTNGVPGPPTDLQVASSNEWQALLNALQGLQSIDVVVPVVGQGDSGSNNDTNQGQILNQVQGFIETMKAQNEEYVIGVFGEDSTTGAASEAMLQTHAVQLQGQFGGDATQQCVLLNIASLTVAGHSGSTYNVGAQYAAAAVGGMLVSRSPSATLTRQPIAGFLQVADVRTKPQKNADAGSGLMVVESQGPIVQIRHAITLDLTSVATRELNVVHAKHYMLHSVVDTLENQVIGKVPADANATTTVNNVIIGILEELRGLRYIDAYANVESRITSLDPTAMEVRFAYRPLFYVNYITVVFSIDLTAGTVSVNSSGVTG